MANIHNDTDTAVKLNLLYLKGKLHKTKPFNKQLGNMINRNKDKKNMGGHGLDVSPLMGW